MQVSLGDKVSIARPWGALGVLLALPFALAAPLFSACQPALDPMGVSTALPSLLRYDASADPEPEAATWEAGARLAPPIDSNFRSSFARVHGARFKSRGHSYERYMADVYVPAGQLDVFRTGEGNFVVGSVIVMDQYERYQGGVRHAGIFIMQKQAPGYDAAHGDWRYTVVGRGGAVLEDGPLAACRGCHRDAARDYVFPVVP